ncbi:hypothetical protein CHS0354_019892 [Potamilus streckersoni]|uniref:Glycosyltransferase 8 domain-containing protein 1 n=1 Tax=Potamilus streckersoni TaxID=2493646 RepID=A0AAE0SN88_9BIVA|nr:hypothetical protein CHS0354_019892 [Potamilus streckersoni]
MGILSTKRIGIVLALVWLGIMVYLWFPNLLPGFASKSKNVDRGIYRAELFQMMRLNVSNLTDAVHVCITSDKDTIGGMIALINSIYTHSKHPVVFHLVSDEQSVEHVRTWIKETKLHDIIYEIKAFPSKWVEGKIKLRGGRPELGEPLNYARYYLPRLFPDLNGKVIFIDDDSIVQADVYELSQVNLKHGHIAAFSSDCTGGSKRLTMRKNIYADYIDFKNKKVKELNISPTECSFNTGVFVTDIDLWRKENITQKLEYWLELNTREEVYGNEIGGGGSQPPMMLVFYRNYTHLEPNWNIRYLGLTPGTSYTKSFLKEAKLIHWSGTFKPWGRTAQHSDIWDKYYIQDPSGKFEPIRRYNKG